MQSDGQSPSNPGGLLKVHVAAGTVFLQVEGLVGTGGYTITTTLTPTSPPIQPTTPTATFFGTTISTAVADFNGDGIPDIAAPDGLHLGIGDGTFRNPTGSNPFHAVGDPLDLSIVSGDFNGDGIPDLAIADLNARDLTVWLGQGDGSFRAPIEIADAHYATALLAGDFNGDGKLDLAVANESETANSDGSISVFLGNGDGTFQAAKQVEVGDDPVHLVSGDFNGDGTLDLAVANSGNTGNDFGTFDPGDVSVLLGNGDGSFRPQMIYSTEDNPQSVVSGDFNGDGHLDLFANGIILTGNGDGTFRPSAPIDGGVFGGPNRIGGNATAGDFNGDGKPDLAISDNTGVFVLLGNGDGTFESPALYSLGAMPGFLVLGDFNGDGHLDLASGLAEAQGSRPCWAAVTARLKTLRSSRPEPTRFRPCRATSTATADPTWPSRRRTGFLSC